uniref:Uncharacterized protein n=1 Tax=Phasianus colchicus TaxID=9054 RepID=A0A669QGR6_PHACC
SGEWPWKNQGCAFSYTWADSFWNSEATVQARLSSCGAAWYCHLPWKSPGHLSLQWWIVGVFIQNGRMGICWDGNGVGIEWDENGYGRGTGVGM